MLEPPDLSDETIHACLRDAYNISVSKIEFLPLGNDASAWVYRVNDVHACAYFLKVRAGTIDENNLRLPRWLYDSGIEQVVAPLPVQNGRLWTSVDSFGLTLFPFIDGDSGMKLGLTPPQWIEFGKIVRQIHSTRLPDDLRLRLRHENFVLNPQWMQVVRELGRIAIRGDDDPAIQELARFCHAKQAEINRLADRAEELGRLLRNRKLDFFLCHADIHTANVLIDQAGALHITDWD